MKRALVIAAALVTAAACASVPDRNETVVVAKPDATDFAYVNAVLVRRCGTLDCHGEDYRNMRLYGYLGRRLDPSATSTSEARVGGVPTTSAELDQSYRSVTGLEPEILSGVVQGTRPPEDLTLIRKGRYTEFHKGGSPLKDHPPADACVVSWLKGHAGFDRASCCSELSPSYYALMPECCANVPADLKAKGICP